MGKRKITVFVVVAALLLIGMGGYLAYQNYISKENSMTIYLPKKDIGNYEIITQEDIVPAKVDKNQDLKQFAVTPEQLIGKAAVTNLFAKTPVPKRALGEPENMQDVVFLTIHTDYTRAGGAKVGDRVDVDYIAVNLANNVKGVSRTELVRDARVVSITDSNGNPAYTGGVQSPVYGGTQSPVQAVKLAIKPYEKTAELVYGAISAENGLVLTVKYDDAVKEKVQPINIIPEEKEAPSATSGEAAPTETPSGTTGANPQ